MKKKREILKAQWIERYKKDRSLDDIIFQDDEEVHDQVKMKFAYLKDKEEKPGQGGRDRRTQKNDDREITDAEWGERFDDLLNAHLIDVPDDYYDNERAFNDPDELNSIFNELEEKNLFNIHQLQDLEIQLEHLKQEEKKIKSTLQMKYDQQNRSLQELQNKINESKLSLEAAKKKTTGDLLYEPPDADQIKRDAKKGKEAKPQPVKFELMLSEIKLEISRIYKNYIGAGDASGKSPVSLLDVS